MCLLLTEHANHTYIIYIFRQEILINLKFHKISETDEQEDEEETLNFFFKLSKFLQEEIKGP